MSLRRYRHIVVLTGAGISQAAGLPTYRGPGGLWTDPELARMSDVSALTSHRAEACGVFWRFRRTIATVAPTAAHRALAAFEAALPDDASFLIVTQNVDGLHQKAGSKNVCEYHGTLARWRCEQCSVELEPPDGEPPVHCGELMRPAAVLFGEYIAAHAEHAATRALAECDLFVAIGTSGTVWPAANFVRWAALAGAHRILINLEIEGEAREDFDECHAGTADELVGSLFGA